MKKQQISLSGLNNVASVPRNQIGAGLEYILPDDYVFAAIINATAGDGGHNRREYFFRIS